MWRPFDEGDRQFILTFIDFLKKIYDSFLNKWEMGYGKLCKKSKMKKNIIGGDMAGFTECQD